MFRKLDLDEVVAGRVTIVLDGEAFDVEEGEPIAAILLRHAPYTARTTAISGLPRAPYCMMGACFDCLVEIDGVTSTRSCMARAEEGMIVRRQAGRPNPLEDFRID